ncbi:hypothetical protein SDC9_72057 [bioreactor metagenome]|uniref:Uncharacterized protein n=1 Tax=bioreactor metagenome TaxID=1076179 RepID=A0A644YCD7_9ZZZZ
MIRKALRILVLITGLLSAKEAFPQRKVFSGIDMFLVEGVDNHNSMFKCKFSFNKKHLCPVKITIRDRGLIFRAYNRDLHLISEEGSNLIYTSRSRRWYLGYDLDTIHVVKNKLISITKTTISKFSFGDPIPVRSLIQLEKVKTDSIVLSEYLLFHTDIQPSNIFLSDSVYYAGLKYSFPDSINAYIRFSISLKNDRITSCSVLEGKSTRFFIKDYPLVNFPYINPEEIIGYYFNQFLILKILCYR